MTNRILLTILLLFLVWPTYASNLYPEWFLFPQKYPRLQVGYTYNGAIERIDAENMYCAFKECVVLGTLEIFQDDSQDDYLKNSDYFYYYSMDSVMQIQNRLHKVDQFCISTLNDEWISAFSLDSGLVLNAPQLELDEIERPDWIDRDFFEDQQHYYGIGMYTSIGGEADAWKTAEEKAIFTILTNLAVQMHKLRLVNSNSVANSEMAQISIMKVKYLLRNIQILERYPDRENQLFFALVRIPRADVISPLLHDK